MAVVSRGNEPAGGIQVLVAPGTQLQSVWQLHAGRGEEAGERPHHEKPPMNLEAGIKKDAGVGAGGVEQQLGFHAVHLGRVLQQFEQVAEQRFLNLVSWGFASLAFAGGAPISVGAGQRKDVADDGLGLLIDAEDIADDMACLQGRVAGQHVAVDILHQQVCRDVVVPMEALLPQFALRLQHGAQHRRLKVPQVEDLEGGAHCHASPLATVVSGQ